MKIKLLIATADGDYANHLSTILSEKYAETFEVSVCSSAERLKNLLAVNKYDAALLEYDFACDFASDINLSSISPPLVMIDETGVIADDNNSFKRIRKYQRVSAIAGNLLENYAEIGKGVCNFDTSRARITAVWSPSGGSGKTTVALAYAAQRIAKGNQAVYFNLENFSSAPAYFQESGKSISKVFEKLESNVQLLLLGIRQQDAGSGILYFCGPENYDDINILTSDDIETLVDACATDIDELVIDLSSQCDERTQKVFEIANIILIVCDPSITTHAKLRQFISQSNAFGRIQTKTVLVNNKGAKTTEPGFNKIVPLPFVNSADPISVYKSLSSGRFDW